MIKLPRHSSQRGFSLIEMMIGIAIGLLGLLAVTTVFIKFNQHRTVETSLMEAQSNGTMAMFLLERDIDRAGYGLMDMQTCACKYVNAGGVTITQNAAFCEWSNGGLVNPQSTMPISITDGGTHSDSIFVQYGTPAGGLSSTQIFAKQNGVAEDFQLKSTAGIMTNDVLVLNRGGTCAAYQATGISEGLKTVSHATGSINPAPAAWPAVGYDTAFPNDVMVNLGQYVSKNLRVDEAAAQLVENTRPTYANNTPVVDNIVYMKAELGIDNNGDKRVDAWGKPANVANYDTIVAVRLGIVARTQAKDTDSPTPATLVVLPAVGGGAQQDYTVPDKKYRYKVYYTVIPLRNMIWRN